MVTACYPVTSMVTNASSFGNMHIDLKLFRLDLCVKVSESSSFLVTKFSDRLIVNTFLKIISRCLYFPC